MCLSSVRWWGSDEVQVCLIEAQVKTGAGVWWMMIDWDGGQTDEFVTLPPPPGREGGRPEGWCRAGTLGKPPGRVWVPVAMADRVSWVAMADRVSWVAMADREPRTGSLGWPWPIFSRWPGPVREFCGLGPRPGHADKGYIAHSQHFSVDRLPGGALGKHRFSGALGKRKTGRGQWRWRWAGRNQRRRR